MLSQLYHIQFIIFSYMRKLHLKTNFCPAHKILLLDILNVREKKSNRFAYYLKCDNSIMKMKKKE